MERRPFALAVGEPVAFKATVISFHLSQDGSRALVGLVNHSASLCDVADGMKELRRFRPYRALTGRGDLDGTFSRGFTPGYHMTGFQPG